jgi:hypothetical protein
MNITIDISLTDKEAQKFYDIMPEGRFKEFVLKRYIEKKTLETIAKEMDYTERHMFKISSDVKTYAIKVLLSQAVASEV